jgi:hypothetical protein
MATKSKNFFKSYVNVKSNLREIEKQFVFIKGDFAGTKKIFRKIGWRKIERRLYSKNLHFLSELFPIGTISTELFYFRNYIVSELYTIIHF